MVDFKRRAFQVAVRNDLSEEARAGAGLFY